MGNCSHKNAISLNTKLVALPKDLMDYVILFNYYHREIQTVIFALFFKAQILGVFNDSKPICLLGLTNTAS
jgi:hypothetical protein